MTAKGKPRIFDNKLLSQLIKLPDLLEAEDLDSLPKALLLETMHSLDHASDLINDYLEKHKHTILHTYPDIKDNLH